MVQQGVLLAVFVLAGAGAARLVPGRAGAAAAALAYAWTPYVAERLLIGHWTFLLGYAVLPWVVGAALAARRGGSLRPLLLWLAAAAAAGSTSALIATATALACWACPHDWRPGPRPDDDRPRCRGSTDPARASADPAAWPDALGRRPAPAANSRDRAGASARRRGSPRCWGSRRR